MKEWSPYTIGSQRMNRSSFVKVLGGDHRKWAERHGIEPFSQPCSHCGELVTTTIPIATTEFRGLLAPPCVCGANDAPYCFVRLSSRGDLFTGR